MVDKQDANNSSFAALSSLYNAQDKALMLDLMASESFSEEICDLLESVIYEFQSELNRDFSIDLLEVICFQHCFNNLLFSRLLLLCFHDSDRERAGAILLSADENKLNELIVDNLYICTVASYFLGMPSAVRFLDRLIFLDSDACNIFWALLINPKVSKGLAIADEEAFPLPFVSLIRKSNNFDDFLSEFVQALSIEGEDDYLCLSFYIGLACIFYDKDDLAYHHFLLIVNSFNNDICEYELSLFLINLIRIDRFPEIKKILIS